MTVDLQTILDRATAGRSLDNSRMFRLSWFYSMIKNPYWVWCEYHAPWQERVDETTLFDRHRMQMGNDWEDQYVVNNFPSAHVIKSQWSEVSLRETLMSMLHGDSAIGGGALWLRPKQLATLNWKHLPASQMTMVLHYLIESARETRRAKYSKCEWCDEIKPPEWIHNLKTCQSCAERDLGIVH